MFSSSRRLLSIGIVIVFIFGTTQMQTVQAATKNAHGEIYSVKVFGGSNSATVSWKVKYYHHTLLAYTWGVHIYPKNHPFKTPSQTTSCPGSPCSFYIPTPKAHTGKNPAPLLYYFVVFASNVSGGFGSNPSSSVLVKFASTKTPIPSPVATISATPTSAKTPTATPSPVATVSATPTPSQTPTPTPKAPSISDFDGSYSGSLNISLTPAMLPPQVVPFSLKLINGRGDGQGGSWRGSGVVNDAQGNASVTISNAIYGVFTVPITFSLNNTNQKKTGTGSGRYTVLVRGFGEITFDFSFTLSTK